MRLTIKLILVLVLSAAATVAAGRLLTGRTPSAPVLAAGTVGLVLAVLALDAAIGW